MNKKNQEPKVKRFFRETGIIDKDNKTTALYDIVLKLGWESETSWGIMIVNFVENPSLPGM